MCNRRKSVWYVILAQPISRFSALSFDICLTASCQTNEANSTLFIIFQARITNGITTGSRDFLKLCNNCVTAYA